MAEKTPSINNRKKELEELLEWLEEGFEEYEEAAQPWHSKFRSLRELFEGKVEDYYNRGDDDDGATFENSGTRKQLFRSMVISQMVRSGVGIIEGTTLRPYVSTTATGNPLFQGISDLSTDLLKIWFEGGDVRDEFDECIVDYCLNGSCIAVNPWNPDIGKSGTVDLWHIPLVNTFPEPGVKKFKRMRRVYFDRIVNLMEVRAKYGKNIEDRLDAVGFSKKPDEITGETRQIKKKFRIKTCYFKDDDNKWTCVVYSGQVILEHKGTKGDKPFPYNELPYFHARCNIYPGEFWGKGIGEDIESIERILDKLFQQVIANQQDVGSSQLFYNPADMPEDFEPTDMPGIAVPMKTNRSPANSIHYKPAVSILGDAGNLMGILNSRLVDITGIHSPAVGKRGRANESGEAIKALQGGTNQTFAPSIVRWIRFIRRISENTLGLMYKNAKLVEQLDTLTPDVKAVIKILSKDFPHNFRPTFDIDIQDDSKLPKDPASRAELAARGIEMGATDAQYWREQVGINDAALEQRVNQMQQMAQQMQQMQQAMEQMQQQLQQTEAQNENLETQLQRSTLANAESRVQVMLNKQDSRNSNFEATVTKQRLQMEAALNEVKLILKQIVDSQKNKSGNNNK